MWVPIVENGEADSPGADYFVDKYLAEILAKDPEIDTLLLACTHYPLLRPKIEQSLRRLQPEGHSEVSLLSQGAIVAESLKDYLRRHPEIETQCGRGGKCSYLTTESEHKFAQSATIFMAEEIEVKHIDL